MFIYTALEIGFKNTMLADLTPAEGETLYNAAIACLENGKYAYDVEGDLADGLENVRFSVFNICLSGCRRLATLMLQHTFLYRDLTKGPEWFAYSTKEASQEKLRKNLQTMTLEQFHKLAYQHYRLFYRKAQTPLQELDGRMQRLNQALLADEQTTEAWSKANQERAKTIKAEVLWSLDERNTGSSRYFARGKLWKMGAYQSPKKIADWLIR